MPNYSVHGRRRMRERNITEDEVIAALNRQSGPPTPGDNGSIVKFGYSGSRILKVVLTADEHTVVSVMWVGEGNEVTMRLEFDLNVGALYIRLSDAAVARTQEAGDNAAVDLDSAGHIVGIEVVSAVHPWPLTDILASYAMPPGEAAQLRSYFLPRGMASARQESPKLSIASPAPAKALVAA